MNIYSYFCIGTYRRTKPYMKICIDTKFNGGAFASLVDVYQNYGIKILHAPHDIISSTTLIVFYKWFICGFLFIVQSRLLYQNLKCQQQQPWQTWIENGKWV